MTVFGSSRSWRALLSTGFAVVITILLAQPAAAQELVPSHAGVHFGASPASLLRPPPP
jgi:hypothetical protein